MYLTFRTAVGNDEMDRPEGNGQFWLDNIHTLLVILIVSAVVLTRSDFSFLPFAEANWSVMFVGNSKELSLRRGRSLARDYTGEEGERDGCVRRLVKQTIHPTNEMSHIGQGIGGVIVRILAASKCRNLPHSSCVTEPISPYGTC